MKTEIITVSMGGGIAENHRLPAYMGSKTIYGVSRSILIVTNYLVEGRVRKKDYDLTKYNINILPPREGSFEFSYELIYNIGAAAGVMITSGIVGNFAYDILKKITRTVLGDSDHNTSDDTIDDVIGDNEASLAAAIEPSVRESHSVINYGVMNVNIFNNNRSDSIKYNKSTKDFVWESVIDRGVRTKLFSVGRFDGTSGSGMVFDYEDRRTVSFQIEKGADEATVNAMLWSLSQYGRKKLLGDNLKSAIALKYTTLTAIDGRAKKLFIQKARREIEML